MKGFVLTLLAVCLIGTALSDPIRKGGKNPKKPKGECPHKDPADPIFLPDDEDCAVYYECSNGDALQLTCADGLWWDEKNLDCLLPEESDCAVGSKKLPRSPIGECPHKDPANPVFLGDDKDCSIYYECSNGVPIMNNCADGLYWDERQKTCVLEDDSDCKQGGGSGTTTKKY